MVKIKTFMTLVEIKKVKEVNALVAFLQWQNISYSIVEKQKEVLALTRGAKQYCFEFNNINYSTFFGVQEALAKEGMFLC